MVIITNHDYDFTYCDFSKNTTVFKLDLSLSDFRLDLVRKYIGITECIYIYIYICHDIS